MSVAAARVRRSGRLTFSRVDEDLLGVDTADGFVYTLNETGRRVWELLADWTTTDEICDALSESYDVDRVRCQAEVDEVLARLAENRLIETEGAAL